MSKFWYIEISKDWYIEISIIWYIEISIIWYIEISNVWYIEISNECCPPSPGMPVFCMQILVNESLDVSNIEIVSRLFFVSRYRIHHSGEKKNEKKLRE